MPHGTDEAEDRHSNFYDAWVNLTQEDLDRLLELFVLGFPIATGKFAKRRLELDDEEPQQSSKPSEQDNDASEADDAPRKPAKLKERGASMGKGTTSRRQAQPDDPMFGRLMIVSENEPPGSTKSYLEEINRQIRDEAAPGIDPDPTFISPTGKRQVKGDKRR